MISANDRDVKRNPVTIIVITIMKVGILEVHLFKDHLKDIVTIKRILKKDRMSQFGSNSIDRACIRRSSSMKSIKIAKIRSISNAPFNL
jgi:hypothetical protein